MAACAAPCARACHRRPHGSTARATPLQGAPCRLLGGDDMLGTSNTPYRPWTQLFKVMHEEEDGSAREDGSSAVAVEMVSVLMQVVITSYDMMMRLTCDACCAGGKAINAANVCKGPDACLAAKGFKARTLWLDWLRAKVAEDPVQACSMRRKRLVLHGIGWHLQIRITYSQKRCNLRANLRYVPQCSGAALCCRWWSWTRATRSAPRIARLTRGTPRRRLLP